MPYLGVLGENFDMSFFFQISALKFVLLQILVQK